MGRKAIVKKKINSDMYVVYFLLLLHLLPTIPLPVMWDMVRLRGMRTHIGRRGIV